MSEQLRSFQLWAQAHIVSSLSWPVSFLIVSSLAAFIDLSKPTLPILWLLGVTMGGITTLSSSLIVRHQIAGTWKWAIANIVGIPFSLTVAYLLYPFTTSLLGFAATGFCSGLITSMTQSLAIKRQYSKIAPLISGTLGWALAFLFGYLLVMQDPTVTFVFMPNNFFRALLLGWGVSAPILLILYVGLSPMSHDKPSSGTGISYN